MLFESERQYAYYLNWQNFLLADLRKKNIFFLQLVKINVYLQRKSAKKNETMVFYILLLRLLSDNEGRYLYVKNVGRKRNKKQKQKILPKQTVGFFFV
jgi:hypothetical protein